ncbi:MAG: hypothetical protein ABI262_05825 [Microcoleus sp.]
MIQHDSAPLQLVRAPTHKLTRRLKLLAVGQAASESLACNVAICGRDLGDRGTYLVETGG